MLVLALQFSRAARDQWSTGALAVIAGTAQSGTGDKFERTPHTRVLPQNGTVTSSSSGSRWCLIACKQGEGSGWVRNAN